jgi:hypothetical protein
MVAAGGITLIQVFLKLGHLIKKFKAGIYTPSPAQRHTRERRLRMVLWKVMSAGVQDSSSTLAC